MFTTILCLFLYICHLQKRNWTQHISVSPVYRVLLFSLMQLIHMWKLNCYSDLLVENWFFRSLFIIDFYFKHLQIINSIARPVI